MKPTHIILGLFLAISHIILAQNTLTALAVPEKTNRHKSPGKMPPKALKVLP